MFGFPCHLRVLPERRPWRETERDCLSAVLRCMRAALGRRPGATPIAVDWRREVIALRMPDGDWRVTLKPGTLRHGEKYLRNCDVIRFEVGSAFYNRRKARA